MIPGRGPVREYLLGHSTDPDIRLDSSSGGIATSLMIHLLQSGQVDAALVIGMENERPVARLTDDVDEVRSSSGSKYGPVPMLATLIPELIKRPRRVAATFTPCQLAGWQMAAERIPVLRRSPVLAIGLFCGQIQSYDALRGVAASLGIGYPGGARFTHWRYGPYPGSARFELPDGTAVEKPLYKWLDLTVPHYSLHRCLLCPDGGNWQADMSLGDVHSIGQDETVIVCRNGKARDALESTRQAGRITMREMTPALVERSVIRHITRSKLLPAIACNAWLRKKGRPAPQFDYDDRSLLRGRMRSMALLWVLKYRLTGWCRGGWRRRFLSRHPLLMEKIGHFLYYFPNTLPGWRLLARGTSRLRK
jgi:coenzyme F420 hydrogenase subunit beta